MNGTPSLYGDAIYRPSLNIMSRIEDPQTTQENNINLQNNSARTSIEHLFGLDSNLWALTRNKRKLKLKVKGEQIVKLFYVTLFLTNVYTCLNGNVVSTRYNLDHPTIEEYLPLEEELVLHDE